MRALALLGLAVALGGAASGTLACSPDRPAENPLEYTENARRAYEEALESFFDRDWETATRLFDELRREYGYSRYARLAELRLADIEFKQQKWAEAVAAYKAFAHDYPNDPEVPYARYRAVKALHEQASPSILLGPLEERDLAVVIDAWVALRQFRADFPVHPRGPELDHMFAVLTGALARHELYVARFYRDRDNFPAAVARIQHCLREYPGSGLDAEALVLLGETYLMMKRQVEARQVLTRMLYDHPESPFTIPARKFLGPLGGPDPGVPRTPVVAPVPRLPAGVQVVPTDEDEETPAGDAAGAPGRQGGPSSPVGEDAPADEDAERP